MKEYGRIIRLSCYLAVAMTVMLSSSCSGDDPVPPPDDGSLVAAAEALASGGAGGPFWEAEAKITIVGSSATSFTLSEGAGTATGIFTGDISAAGFAPYYAIFPYESGISRSGSGLSFAVPKERNAASGEIMSGIVPMAASVEDGTVMFHNLFGVLQLSLSSASSVKIKKISLHDLGGNLLWGDCFIPVQADTLAYDNIVLTNGDNTASLSFDGYETFGPEEKVICFPVPPGALDCGFSMVLYEYDASKPDCTGRAYTFVQGSSEQPFVVRSRIFEASSAEFTEEAEPYDIKARGYYKSLFIDAGINLLEHYKPSDLPFIETLGLDSDYEYFVSDKETDGQKLAQNQYFDRTTADGLGWSDQNGQLLYPDNEPRFRMIYVNGGLSRAHGLTLTKQALDNVNTFYKNGGGYIGTCAGSFLATTFYGSTRRYGNADPSEDCSFGIWPGGLTPSRLPVTINEVTVEGKKYDGWGVVVTGMKVVSERLGEYGFAAGDTIQDTWHQGGSFMSLSASNLSFNPDILATYQFVDPEKPQSRPTEYQYTQENLDKTDFPNPFFAYNSSGAVTHSRNLVDSVAVFAYKESPSSGCAVLCGSHPERREAGSRQLPFMEMMVKYVMDGGGEPTVKAALEAGDPAGAKIGDRQYHHFTFTGNADMENVQIKLSSEFDEESGINLYLALRKDDFAWLSDADYVVCSDGGNKTLNIKRLPAGTWYVSVFCATTADAVATSDDKYPRYFEYKGHTEVLDGIDYSIVVE